jgi:hypothetical protein
MNKRKFLNLASLVFISYSFYGFNSLFSKEQKKIINQSLSDKQKKVMFEEATERPFSSPLNQ